MTEENFKITQFTPEFIIGNMHAMCISNFGVFAVSSGSCVHLFTIENTKNFKKLYTITPSQSVITSIKFSTKKRQLLIGDGVGHLQIFDFNLRKIIASSPQSKDNFPICDLCWSGNTIIALKGNRTLSGFNLSENLIINEIWNTQLPILFTRLDIDSYANGNNLLLFGHENHFMILDTKGLNEHAPTLTKVLETQGTIKDAQFHYHIPGYAFFVTESHIYIYHLTTQKLVLLVITSQTTSPFEGIVQFRGTHRSILIRHFNGTIAKYKVEDPYCLTVDKNAIHTQMKQRLFGTMVDPMDDSTAIFFYHPFGVCLFDLERFIIKSCLPIFTGRNLSFDTDSSFYAIGQAKGLIVYGDLNNPESVMNIQVSDKDVTFVSLSKPLINWATEQNVGQINIETRQIKVFKQNHPPIKAVGSHQGGLLVLRRPDILGVFANGCETSIAFNSNIVTFCLHNEDSGISSGKFVVITESREMYFIRYGGGQVEAPFLQLHAVEQMGQIISVAWSGRTISTGATNGIITTINILNPEPVFKQILVAPITYLTYCDNTLYGLFNNTTVFIGTEGKRAQGAFQQIIPLSANEFAFVTPTGHIRFAKSASFETIPDLGLEKKLPPSEERGTIVGLDVKDVIEGKENLRVMSKACSGNNSILVNKIISFLDEQEELEKWALARSFAYSEQTEEAIKVLSSIDITDQRNMFCTMLISTVLGIDGSPNEKQKAFIKERTSKLFEAQRYVDAVTILTLCGMNSFAIEKLLETDQINVSLPMIRGSIPEEQKQRFLFEIGCKLMSSGRLMDAAICFASAHEYHALLFSMFSAGLIQDCRNIKKLLLEKGEITPLAKEKEEKINAIIPLDELIKQIDAKDEGSQNN